MSDDFKPVPGFAMPPAGVLAQIAAHKDKTLDVGAIHRVGTLLGECERAGSGVVSVLVSDLRWFYSRALTTQQESA